MVGGDLTLGAGATLDLWLGAALDDLIAVVGRATLGGLLAVSFADGFAFGEVGLYDLIAFGGYAGAFSDYAFYGLIPGYVADVLYTPGGLKLQVAAVPEPATAALVFAGLMLAAWTARHRGRARRHG